jgi:hypothetical protein
VTVNSGAIESTAFGGDIVVRIYYDATALPVGDTQPLINGPRGFCLDVTNLSGQRMQVRVTPPGGVEQVVDVPQGDPSGVSRTVNQMRNLSTGFRTRGDVQGFSLSAG